MCSVYPLFLTNTSKLQRWTNPKCIYRSDNVDSTLSLCWDIPPLVFRDAVLTVLPLMCWSSVDRDFHRAPLPCGSLQSVWILDVKWTKHIIFSQDFIHKLLTWGYNEAKDKKTVRAGGNIGLVNNSGNTRLCNCNINVYKAAFALEKVHIVILLKKKIKKYWFVFNPSGCWKRVLIRISATA